MQQPLPSRGTALWVPQAAYPAATPPALVAAGTRGAPRRGSMRPRTCSCGQRSWSRGSGSTGTALPTWPPGSRARRAWAARRRRARCCGDGRSRGPAEAGAGRPHGRGLLQCPWSSWRLCVVGIPAALPLPSPGACITVSAPGVLHWAATRAAVHTNAAALVLCEPHSFFDTQHGTLPQTWVSANHSPQTDGPAADCAQGFERMAFGAGKRESDLSAQPPAPTPNSDRRLPPFDAHRPTVSNLVAIMLAARAPCTFHKRVQLHTQRPAGGRSPRSVVMMSGHGRFMVGGEPCAALHNPTP